MLKKRKKISVVIKKIYIDKICRIHQGVGVDFSLDYFTDICAKESNFLQCASSTKWHL